MTQHRVMLFMKGEPDAPRCGFSRKAVALLRDQNVEFGSFDILEDETVRSGMFSSFRQLPMALIE
jgi:glutaredoxin-related protein